MRVYLSYFKLRIITFMQYRSAAIAGLTTQFFWGIMLIFIYTTLYKNGGNASMSLTEVVCYIWLHQAFFALLAVRTNDQEIKDMIRSGGVAYEIIRPYNLYYWWYIKVLAKRISGGMLRFFPVIIFASLLPEPYGLSLPASIANFGLFLISLILGILLVSAINMLVHTIGFFTYNEEGFSSMLNSVMELLSGEYIPVALLPLFIQRGTYFLPFRLILDLPFRLYSNNIGLIEGIQSIGLQIVWIIVLILIGNQIVKESLKRVFVQGG